ncbi:uncharacterized protein LOC133517427, partial [Cydia pomonella]|uniref:uncharacterized protein LOC133517427 n=1 Tax=Cydia pomonella TaxID=82600 RepID=UPI002ADE143C
MDGLIHAALEAEVILNRAKHVNTILSPFDRGVPDHKMTWTHDKMHFAEPVDESRTKFQRSVGGAPSKAVEKFDLFKKLHELYSELSRDEVLHGNFQGLKTSSYLLEKLLAKYNLNTLIVNLYPGNKGYSLSLKINGSSQHNPGDPNTSTSQHETLIETPRWPYEEEDLLSYIDNEELPVVLLDLLEAEHSCLFYSGCIIAQIRDYRQAYPSFLCDTHHVLLRPTNQSIITDASCIGGRCGWAGEERGALEAVEAALVHAAAPPLCLDPRPAVGLLAARLHAAPRLFNTPRIRRQARRFSQVAVNRKRKLDQFTHYHGLELLELIHRQRAKNSRQSVPHTRLTSKFPKKPPEVFKPIESPRMEAVPLAPPSSPGGPLRLARAYERPRPTPDCQPQLVEEYVLETERAPPHAQAQAGFFHIKLSILQRPSDQEFLGELYVDRDHVEGEKNGAACRFTLGSRLQANKYIQQFTEIFTEEGRKSVRIKHIVPGQLPRVSFTGGMREMGQQLLQQRSAAASNATVHTHATTGPGEKHYICLSRNSNSWIRFLCRTQLRVVRQNRNSSTNCPFPASTIMFYNSMVLRSASACRTPAISATPNTHTNARQLPILQAQLQQVASAANVAAVGSTGTVGVGTVGVGSVGVGSVGVGVGVAAAVADPALKPLPSPTTPRLSPQVQNASHEIHSTQASTNQLLAQQLTNPPQPLNPQKLQSAIIHIQHPLMSTTGTSQVQSIQYSNASSAQQKPTMTKPRTTNPAISALVTSLMNSAQQFQQAASQKSAVSTASTSANKTILNLLNSAPAAMTHVSSTADSVEHKLLGRTVSIAGARLITATTASHTMPTYTQQVGLQSPQTVPAPTRRYCRSAVTTDSTGANKTILNLLNSAPAAMTHVSSTADSVEHKLLGRTVSIAGARLITATTASHTMPTYTQQTILNLLNSAPAAMTHVSSTADSVEHKLLGRTVSIAGARLITATTASHTMPTYTQQTILNLLNSAPAAMTHVSSTADSVEHKLLGRTVSIAGARLITATTASHTMPTYTQQTILNLLNSAPAAMTHVSSTADSVEHKLLGRTVSIAGARLITATTASHTMPTYTQQTILNLLNSAPAAMTHVSSTADSVEHKLLGRTVSIAGARLITATTASHTMPTYTQQTILNLLNSAPAAMTHVSSTADSVEHKLLGRTVSIAGARLITATTASHTMPTYTQQTILNLLNSAPAAMTHVSSTADSVEHKLLGRTVSIAGARLITATTASHTMPTYTQQTILNLLNSAPAAMTHVSSTADSVEHKLLGRTVSIAGARLITATTASHTMPTYTQQTILNLLNSAPAAMTHVSSTADSVEHKLLGRTVSIAGARLITATTASHTMPTYTQQRAGRHDARVVHRRQRRAQAAGADRVHRRGKTHHCHHGEPHHAHLHAIGRSAVTTDSTGANKTILNLLNSAPAAMTHVSSTADSVEHKLLGRTVSIAGARLITATTASHTMPTYTQQVLGGYTCESNETTNVSSSESALLERLMGPEAAPPAQPQPQPVCHVQGLSLASLQGLQGIQGLQNVQVQIPGLSAPISLSLNVSGSPSGLLVSVPPTTSVVLNQPSVLSLPIAQLMGGGVKGAVRGGVQVVRGVAGAGQAGQAGAAGQAGQAA